MRYKISHAGLRCKEETGQAVLAFLTVSIDIPQEVQLCPALDTANLIGSDDVSIRR